MQQLQGNHVRANECVRHGLNVASPGWDGTSTGSQSRDWEWNQWCPRGTKQNQEGVTNIALWKYKPRSSHKTQFIVLSNSNSIISHIAFFQPCCPVLPCCHVQDVAMAIWWIEIPLSMHLTWYCMDPSILFHAQRGTLGKKSKFNSLMVDWHSCFHLPQGHSTQLQMWHHLSVILDTNCPKTFLGHLHYFHTWSCLLPTKYKRSF